MKVLSSVFSKLPKVQTKRKNSVNFPDLLIETRSRNCHSAFGGKWVFCTYKKSNGVKYTTHSINCIKCEIIQTKLYASTQTVLQHDNVKPQTQLKQSNGKNLKKNKSPPMYYGIGAGVGFAENCKVNTPKSVISSMKLTRHGYNISPTKKHNI
jgi:hypothetical protein